MKRLLLILMPLVILMMDCSSDLSDDPIPYSAFSDIIVNLSLPENFTLQSDGNFKNINGGVKGIILYRLNANTFRAFERTCSYQPGDACATVEVHATLAYMHDTCCGSTFNFEGEPRGGPAWRRLRQYEARVSGTEVIITDEILDY